MFGIGFVEIIVVLGVALVIIGPKNMPGMAKSLGKGYVEFMRTFREMQRSIQDDILDVKKTVDDATNIFDHHEPDKRKKGTDQEKKGFNHSKREGEPR